MPQSRLVSALTDVAIAADDDEAVQVAESMATELADRPHSSAVRAMVRSVFGRIAGWRGDSDAALALSRDALEGFRELCMPYEVACERQRLGRVCADRGDAMTARLEYQSALDGFAGLGASPDADRVRLDLARLGRESAENREGLSARELEVLRLVAQGRTNREAAEELFVSEHTVARHLANIYTKLGVRSRAGATSWAYSRGLLD
jgi:ATP/maltotriose-dependent transcriptional regulator MalT